jgi:hypothetical protein
MGTWKEGRVGAEKAVANKILGDSSTWMGVQAGAAFGSCLGPGGAAAGALVGGLAGSLCYGKLLQERVEKNIEAEAARRQRDEAYRERVRKEVASDLEREIAEREREEARRSHEQFKAWQKQRADLEAFVAAQKAKERVDAGGTWGAGGGAAVQDRPPDSAWGAGGGAAVQDRPPDSGWGAGGGAALQDRPSGSGRVPPAPAVDTPPVSSGTGGGWRPSQPQTVIVMPPSQPVAPPPPFLLPPPQLAEPRRGAPPTPGGSTGGRASSTAPPTRPPAGQGQAGGNQNCHEHDAQLQRLMAEQQRLLRQTQTAQVQQNPGQQRAIACQIVTNSNQVLNLLQHLRSVGCPVRGDLETAIRSGGHWQSLCSGR